MPEREVQSVAVFPAYNAEVDISTVAADVTGVLEEFEERSWRFVARRRMVRTA